MSDVLVYCQPCGITFYKSRTYLCENKGRCMAEPVNQDNVDHPKYYEKSHPSGIECITITEHMNFCLGNAMKYIWRCNHKGNVVEDLKKAVWYINREIERISK